MQSVQPGGPWPCGPQARCVKSRGATGWRPPVGPPGRAAWIFARAVGRVPQISHAWRKCPRKEGAALGAEAQ
eukprot:3707951-Pyramimonas_sp.AAC.1